MFGRWKLVRERGAQFGVHEHEPSWPLATGLATWADAAACRAVRSASQRRPDARDAGRIPLVF